MFITQGYICRNSYGEIDNLKRGGSDYTASIVGNAVNASEIQIWTDIDGMHNNDPRVVDKTKPVAKLSFDEAAELAYFGAKILHPQSIRPAAQLGIPVKLLNTLDPSAKGTTISNETGDGFVKAIAVDYIKDGIRCNAILPGTVETPSWEGRVQMADDPEQARKEFIARQAMGRLAQPNEIASMAVYLASDESDFVTGTLNLIDGGWTL